MRAFWAVWIWLASAVPASAQSVADQAHPPPVSGLPAIAEALTSFEAALRKNDVEIQALLFAIGPMEAKVSGFPYALFEGVFEKIGGVSVEDTLFAMEAEPLPEKGTEALIEVKQNLSALAFIERERPSTPAAPRKARFCLAGPFVSGVEGSAGAATVETEGRRLNTDAALAGLANIRSLHTAVFQLHVETVATLEFWRSLFRSKVVRHLNRPGASPPDAVIIAGEALESVFPPAQITDTRSKGETLFEKLDLGDRQHLIDTIDKRNDAAIDLFPRAAAIDRDLFVAIPGVTALLEARIASKAAMMELEKALNALNEAKISTPPPGPAAPGGPACTPKLDGTFASIAPQEALKGIPKINKCTDRVFFVHSNDNNVETASGVLTQKAPNVPDAEAAPSNTGKGQVSNVLQRMISKDPCGPQIYIPFSASVAPSHVDMSFGTSKDQDSREPLRFSIEAKNWLNILLWKVDKNNKRPDPAVVYSKDLRWICTLVLPKVLDNGEAPPAIATLRATWLKAKDTEFCKRTQ